MPKVPSVEFELERRKKRAAIVFVLAVIFMLIVAGIILRYFLEHRPV